MALAAAALLAGCGERGSSASAPASAAAERGGAAAEQAAVGDVIGGSVVQYADCEDWKNGTEAERRATVVALRRQLTPQGSASARSPLSDERAYEILDKACSTDFADSLRLYKMYVRAQGFAPLND